MRVLIVAGSYPPMPCGVGDYTGQLARALARRDDLQVGVLTGRAARETAPGIDLMARMDTWGLRDLGAVDRAVRDFAPDILHLQHPTLGYATAPASRIRFSRVRAYLDGQAPLLAPLAAFRHGVPTVRTYHEAFGRKFAPALALQALAPGGYIVVRPDFPSRMHAWLRPFARAQRCKLIEGASAIPASRASPAEIAALRARHLGGAERLIAFFGFVYPDKGTDLVFEIADPARDRLVIVGKVIDFPYTREVAAMAQRAPWRGRVTYTGFLPVEETAAILKAADAVVLPFREGGGSWNSSIGAAVKQGTPVITTSRARRGFDARGMIDWSAPGDIPAMRAALDRLAGQRRAPDPKNDSDDWVRIAERHAAFYRECLA